MPACGQTHKNPNLFFAGQITGVEGYVESAAHGLLTGRLVAADLDKRVFTPPPETTGFRELRFGREP